MGNWPTSLPIGDPEGVLRWPRELAAVGGAVNVGHCYLLKVNFVIKEEENMLQNTTA